MRRNVHGYGKRSEGYVVPDGPARETDIRMCNEHKQRMPWGILHDVAMGGDEAVGAETPGRA
jgi:hypothetical protein